MGRIGDIVAQSQPRARSRISQALERQAPVASAATPSVSPTAEEPRSRISQAIKRAGFGIGPIGQLATQEGRRGIVEGTKTAFKSLVPEKIQKGILENVPLQEIVGETVRTGLAGPPLAPRLATPIDLAAQALRVIPKRRIGEEVSKQVFQEISPVGIAAAGVPAVSRLLRGGQKVKEAIFFGKTTNKLKTQLIDRFAPVAHLVNEFEKVVGRKALPAENVFEGARLFSGIPGRINQRSKQFGDIIAPVANNTDDLSRVLIAERNAELVSQGRGVAQNARIKLRSGKAVPVDDIVKLEAEFGPEKLTQLRQIANQVTEFNNSELLADAVDAGIVSQQSAQSMLARNEKFVPFEVLETLADDLVEEGGLRFGRQSFQVAKQDVFKRLEGGAQVLDNPILAQMRKIFKVTQLAERNRVGRTLLQMRQVGPEAERFIKPLARNQRPPRDFSEFTVFEDGQPVRIAIPSSVADSLKGMTQESIDFITRAASVQSKALRVGATAFSPGFIFTNAIRDFQTASLVSKAMGVKFNGLTWARGLGESILSQAGKSQLFDDFERSLGSFGGFFTSPAALGRGITPERALRQIAPTTGQKIAKFGKVLNPLELIRKSGEILELAPRLAVFRQAQNQGLSKRAAAFASRTATVDFSRMGSSMKLVNMWVPFLNARTQGTINAFNAVKNNPLGSATVIGSMVTAPQVATYYWNTRKFPEIWDSIPQFEKDTNFIVILGDDAETQPNGSQRFTQVIKIPKGDVGRVFGNPTENALAALDQTDSKALDTVALQMLSDISPIPFERDEEFAPAAALSGITPPALKAAQILVDPTAKNQFTGFPVVPRSLQEVSPELRRTGRTSETLRRAASTPLGRAINLSPIQTEAAIGATTGGGGRLILGAIDKLLGQDKPNPLTSAVTRRFVGASGNAERERQFNRIDELRRKGADRRQTERLEAEAILNLILDPATNAEGNILLQRTLIKGKNVSNRLTKLAEQRAKGITSVDRALKGLSVKERAIFIQEELNKIKDRGQRLAFLQEMVRKKILSKGVRSFMSRRITP